MRFSAKIYARLLARLASEARDERELTERINDFLSFVDAQNDSRLLKKIAELFEYALISKGEVERIRIEFANDADREAHFASFERACKASRNISSAITPEVNPRIGGGMRVLINDSYLIDASFERLTRDLLSPRNNAKAQLN